MVSVKKNFLCLLLQEKVKDRDNLWLFPILWSDRLSYDHSLLTIKKAVGIPFTSKRSGVSHPGSIKTGKAERCFSINSLTGFVPAYSTELVKKTKSFSLKRLDNSSLEGISSLQGPHQVTQKLGNTTFPL